MIERRALIVGVVATAAIRPAVPHAALAAPDRSVLDLRCADDLPASMSRVLTHFAWQLNSAMPDKLRGELLAPLMERLPGTVSTPVMELQRAEYIAVETMRQINSQVCRQAMKRKDLAARCEKLSSVREAWALAQEICAAVWNTNHSHGAACNAAAATGRALDYANNYDTFVYTPDEDGWLDGDDHAPFVCGNSVNVAWCAANATRRRREVFTKAAGILDGAIGLGSM